MADRLKVMMKPMFGDAGNLTPMLCYADGNPLPGQVSVNIETDVDDVARVTVQFVMVEFANPEGGVPKV